MNNWPNEFMAESYRQRILQELEQIRLERFALRSRMYRPRFFERTMFNIANWMIATGNQLREHYEVSSVNCNIRPLAEHSLLILENLSSTVLPTSSSLPICFY